MERHPSQRLESRWLDDQSLGTPRFRELSLEAGHRATFTVSVGDAHSVLQHSLLILFST